MSELIDFDKTLHQLPHDAAFGATYKGMAHIAGTGPRGATCRTCTKWGNRSERDRHTGYYGNGNKDRAGCLKDGYCNHPIPGKADKRFPHYASACRFYEPNGNPPAASKPFDWGEA